MTTEIAAPEVAEQQDGTPPRRSVLAGYFEQASRAMADLRAAQIDYRMLRETLTQVKAGQPVGDTAISLTVGTSVIPIELGAASIPFIEEAVEFAGGAIITHWQVIKAAADAACGMLEQHNQTAPAQ